MEIALIAVGALQAVSLVVIVYLYGRVRHLEGMLDARGMKSGGGGAVDAEMLALLRTLAAAAADIRGDIGRDHGRS